MKAMDNVRYTRSKACPNGLSYIENIFTGFMELHGDRCYGDDRAIVGGLAWLGDMPVTVIANEKGADARQSAARNFGSAHPEGYRKALRLMKQAEKFKRPVVCFVNTSGAYCGIGAEERGQAHAIAENLMEMAALKTPVISILVGEGGSGGALALAVANEVWMLERSVYSVISPEGCASILYKDPAMAEQAAQSLKVTSSDLLGMGVIERVMPDSDSGEMYSRLKVSLIKTLTELSKLPGDEIAALRMKKFRAIGVPSAK